MNGPPASHAALSIAPTTPHDVTAFTQPHGGGVLRMSTVFLFWH